MDKMLKKSVFFCALCAYFLNWLCFAETEGSASKKAAEFIPPLIVADYDVGLLLTNLASLSGGDENLPGTTFTVLVSDDNFTRGNSGYSLMLDYDVSRPGDFSFYWIKLGREECVGSGITRTLDLQGYNYLSLWIKGRSGGEKVKVELHQDADESGTFVFGRDIISYVYIDAYLKEGGLTGSWQKALIPLDAFKGISDRSKMLELVFVFENEKSMKKGAVYVDDIMFGSRPEWVIKGEDAREIQAPLESSFRVNGAKAELCPAFERTNKFTIKAESMHENPFIESVGFECSTDGGNTWRTVTKSYDVKKKTHNVMWSPEDYSEGYYYKVRAVSADIEGNTKTTGILIDCGVKPIADEELLDLIERKAFDFFAEHQNMKTGLFADTTGGGDASIASTGFGITALCVGAERGWIHEDEARKRVGLALDTFLLQENGEKPLAEGKYGFFYHFVDMHTGKRAGKSEISTVDTAILVAGAITAGEYFGGKIKKKAEELYGNVEWDKFLSKDDGPRHNMFSMGWSPERGFLNSYWDFYTDETILICLLAAGSPTHPVPGDTFYAWRRQKGSYGKGKPFIHSWHGALFSYQYAHIWFDLRNLVDKEGVDWFENSRNATLANRNFCIDRQDEIKTFGPNTWGITSMARPAAYTMHFGASPTGGGQPVYDGTISPTGPAGSIIFTPYLSLSALKYIYFTYPKAWGRYGMRDSFNLELDWYAPAYYGISEALYVLPLENFRSDFIWKTFMKNNHIEEALKKTGFTRKK